MTTQVIVRFDDVRGPDLLDLSDWFRHNHPEVPCAAFALGTGTEWDERSWRRARTCIEDDGWEIGGHTRDHPMLSQLARGEIREAVRTNVDDIESGLAAVGLDYTVESFAYPCGDHDERVREVVADEGISNGLTFTDGFPYQSVSSVPTGEDRLAWGVTHNGEFDLSVWNDRFDRVHRRDGLYVLALHPTYWETGVLDPVRRYLRHDVSRSYLRRNLRHGLTRRSTPERWAVLDDHLRHVKSADDVTFTTFEACARNS